MTILKDENYGYRYKSNRVERTYDNLMNKAVRRKLILLEIDNINAKIEEVDFKFSMFDSVYSKADECNFTKDSLSKELDCYRKRILELNQELKEVEKL